MSSRPVHSTEFLLSFADEGPTWHVPGLRETCWFTIDYGTGVRTFTIWAKPLPVDCRADRRNVDAP